ncbi:hypothetical protein KC19_7G150100 [Ceratodon purpureus]|uniref:Uncharacterized protein n=1 Tax=Ceratodon purpureus TaxID=3225 RepID=A0A8T0H9W5_CERPU|nr:hypothetical protein KC19_7G150100 [Ceratodon purpureus]
MCVGYLPFGSGIPKQVPLIVPRKPLTPPGCCKPFWLGTARILLIWRAYGLYLLVDPERKCGHCCVFAHCIF